MNKKESVPGNGEEPKEFYDLMEAHFAADQIPADVYEEVEINAAGGMEAVRKEYEALLDPEVSDKQEQPEPESDENQEAANESSLARFKSQYESLPKSNILDQDSTWEKVKARLILPQYADKMKKVTEELQGGGRLYAVMEDGACEFMDDNSAVPPMFVKDKETEELQIIFNRDEQEMAEAYGQIKAGTHEWASAEEMLNWARANQFDVFEADTKDNLWFGKLMKLAEDFSPDELFVGKKGGDWIATALKDAHYAYFYPKGGSVRVFAPAPVNRYGDLGLLRRLRV